MSNLLLPKQLVCAATAAASGTRLRHKHANGIQYPLMSPRYQFYKQCAMRGMKISTKIHTQHPQHKLSSTVLGRQHSTQADMCRLPLALGRRCAAVQASDDKQLEEGICNGHEAALLHHVRLAAWTRDPSTAMRQLPYRPSGHCARACVPDCLPGGCAAHCHLHVSTELRLSTHLHVLGADLSEILKQDLERFAKKQQQQQPLAGGPSISEVRVSSRRQPAAAVQAGSRAGLLGGVSFLGTAPSNITQLSPYE